MTFYDERDDRPATEAEAHAEWHRNAGHPFDQPGCPWDCYDPPDEPEEERMRSKFDDLTAAEKAALEDAARPLWSALEDLGWVDGHGGSEFGRVFPETIDFVHGQANPSL